MKSNVDAADRSLVISALNGAGYNAQWCDHYDVAQAWKEGWKTKLFMNPLNDHGQAYQLAVECGMTVDVRLEEGVTFAAIPSRHLMHAAEHTAVGALAATARAIVTCAAKQVIEQTTVLAPR